MKIFSSTKVYIKNIFLMAGAIFLVILFLVWNTSANDRRRFSNTEELHHEVKSQVCSVSLEDKRPYIVNVPSQNMIYFVTPTYPRPEQAPELTRLGHTLMHVPRLHWIVADDNNICNPVLDNILRQTKIPFTHIMSPMPEYFRKTSSPPRGVANRRAALQWIHNHTKSGVLYFGDDDNTFDLRLFDEIRDTQRISMFPVGLIGDYGVSSPVIHNGKVVGFFDSWPAKRLWPVDMAGFAINLHFLKANATMPFKAGFEEDRFLQNNHVTLDDIEPKANNCTEVLVWHTQARRHSVSKLVMDITAVEVNPLHLGLAMLIREISHLGMGITTKRHGVVPYIIKEGKAKPLV